MKYVLKSLGRAMGNHFRRSLKMLDNEFGKLSLTNIRNLFYNGNNKARNVTYSIEEILDKLDFRFPHIDENSVTMSILRKGISNRVIVYLGKIAKENSNQDFPDPWTTERKNGKTFYGFSYKETAHDSTVSRKKERVEIARRSKKISENILSNIKTKGLLEK